VVKIPEHARFATRAHGKSKANSTDHNLKIPSYLVKKLLVPINYNSRPEWQYPWPTHPPARQ
jgi:hypothetical protein